MVGGPGTGKGIQSTVLLAQAIEDGEGVIVIDPKSDEWAPSVLKHVCEKARRPFRLIDLRSWNPQINLFAGATSSQVNELLVAGFALGARDESAAETVPFKKLDNRVAVPGPVGTRSCAPQPGSASSGRLTKATPPSRRKPRPRWRRN